jgi:hypothetical protein
VSPAIPDGCTVTVAPSSFSSSVSSPENSIEIAC